MTLQVQDPLDKAWRSTCRVLFGQEVGGLALFQDYLSEMNPKPVQAASSLTGKDVTYSIIDYGRGSKRASLDEIEKLKHFKPLSINEMKDIDSLLEAVRDRAYYTGNVVLGNSDFIWQSSNCNDSHFISDSGVVSDSKYVSSSSRMKQCEYAFGSDGVGESKFVIGNYEAYRNTRCFEAWKSQTCADC